MFPATRSSSLLIGLLRSRRSPNLFPAIVTAIASLSIFLAGNAYGAIVDTVYMFAKVRDFHSNGTHPDFEPDYLIPNIGCYGSGMVLPILDTNNSISNFAGDNRGPIWALPDLTLCIWDSASFSDWYNDKSSTVNRPFLVRLPFLVDDQGVMTYNNQAYFPLDPGQDFVSLSYPPLQPFGFEGNAPAAPGRGPGRPACSWIP